MRKSSPSCSDSTVEIEVLGPTCVHFLSVTIPSLSQRSHVAVYPVEVSFPAMARQMTGLSVQCLLL